MSDDLVERLDKRAKDAAQWLENSQRIVELLQPEWDKFEAREQHNLYTSRMYADHKSHVRSYTKELADWSDAAAEIRSLREQVAKERAGIVAMVRKMESSKMDRIDSILSAGGLDYNLGRCTAYAHAASAIEAEQDKEPT